MNLSPYAFARQKFRTRKFGNWFNLKYEVLISTNVYGKNHIRDGICRSIGILKIISKKEILTIISKSN